MRRSEKGRSMVEMLGVLAIIGVLSVGGIYGYTTAMNKYKANEVAQGMSMIGTLALAANGGTGGDLDETSSGIAVNYCDVSATFNATTGVATVTASDCEGDVGTALNTIVSTSETNNIKYVVS